MGLEDDLARVLGAHDMTEYVSSMIVGEAEDLAASEDVAAAVEALVGEFLVGYEMVPEDQVQSFCAELAGAVKDSQIAKAPKAAPKVLTTPVQLGSDSGPKLAWGSGAYADEQAAGEGDGRERDKDRQLRFEQKEAAAQKERERKMLEAERIEREAAKERAAKALRKHLEARQQRGGGWRNDVRAEIPALRSPSGAVLLEDTSLTLVRGRRYGLVGRNGLGKTSLLRELADYSVEAFPASLRIHHVEQEVAGDSRSALTCVIEADLERTWLLREMVDLEAKGDLANQRYKEVRERLDEITAEDAEARAATILAGLQFTSEMQNMHTSSLSGGWRMRVAIAAALFVAPDLLLLDEPTNHLDFPAVLWLQRWLKQREQTVLLVSHDRGFLDEVATDIVHINSGKLLQYRGNYGAFVEQVAERRLAQQRAYDTQQKEIAHIQEFIDRFDMTKNSTEQNKKTAKHHTVMSQVMSRKRQLEKMERIEDPAVTYGDSATLVFSFSDPEPLRKTELIRCQEVAFGYVAGKPPLFRQFSCSVNAKTRVGVLGANGSGKSTLLKLIQGELEATAGECSINRSMRWARFAQHHVDDLPLHLTATEIARRSFPDVPETEVRTNLAGFGLQGDLAIKPARCLSGGQKSRVALTLVAMRKPHLIFLDEPTNHLDMDTIDAMIGALSKFAGAVLVVSHDQYFLEKVADVFWSISSSTVAIFHSLDEAKKATYAQLQV